MVKPEIKKEKHVNTEPVDVEKVELNIAEDPNANEIKIEKFEGPIKNAIIDIIPGKKVKVNGHDGIFAISQILNDGKVAVLGPEGLILNVKPGELKDIK